MPRAHDLQQEKPPQWEARAPQQWVAPDHYNQRKQCRPSTTKSNFVVQSLSPVWLFATHGLQHARLPCPSPSPGARSNSCPSKLWCHPTILSSVKMVGWIIYKNNFISIYIIIFLKKINFRDLCNLRVELNLYLSVPWHSMTVRDVLSTQSMQTTFLSGPPNSTCWHCCVLGLSPPGYHQTPRNSLR